MPALRLLCFGDLHLDVSAAKRLAGRGLVEPVDFLVSAGDLGLDGRHAPALYDAFVWAAKPVLAVPGNHDGDAPYREQIARSGWIDLDGRVIEHEGWSLGGWGVRSHEALLGGPEPGTQREDAALARLLEQLAGIPAERVVLVTHQPPWGTAVARDAKGVDRGSAQLWRWIRAFQPAAVICGHVHHRDVEVCQLGRTVVVNPGPHGHVLRVTAP